MTVIPVVVGALRTALKGMVKEQENLEINFSCFPLWIFFTSIRILNV